MIRIEKQYINGVFVPSIGSEVLGIINPANSAVIGEAVMGIEEDVLKAIDAAQKAFNTFSSSTIEERKAICKSFTMPLSNVLMI